MKSNYVDLKNNKKYSVKKIPRYFVILITSSLDATFDSLPYFITEFFKGSKSWKIPADLGYFD